MSENGDVRGNDAYGSGNDAYGSTSDSKGLVIEVDASDLAGESTVTAADSEDTTSAGGSQDLSLDDLFAGAQGSSCSIDGVCD